MGDCEQAASAELLKAMADFNRGDWFESHEILEELWSGERGELRDFYQGLIQVGAALHHWRQGNFGGAVRLLETGAGCLRRARPVCQGLDAADIASAADRLREELQTLGPGRMAELAPGLIPRLRLVAEHSGD